MKSPGIQLNMDMADMAFMNGSAKSISKGESGEYVSRMDMILPFNSEELPCKKYAIEYQKQTVEIFIRLIEDKSSDPIMAFGRKFQIDTPSQSGLPEILPFDIFTDNRGKYPALLASIVFPFRIADWVDDSHETGLKMDHDYEAIQATGVPDNKEKFKAIVVINRLLGSLNIPNERKLKYEDITAFSEVYFRKGNNTPLLTKINALASKSAYKDAVEEYYLSNFDKTEIQNSIEKVRDYSAEKDLSNEQYLFDVVNKTIEEVLVHHIENRRWIEPFWDGERKIKLNGEEHVIPRVPKAETKIQPTLHVILDMALRPFGIHVLRESDECIGLIDFRFLYTNKKIFQFLSGLSLKLHITRKSNTGLIGIYQHI